MFWPLRSCVIFLLGKKKFPGCKPLNFFSSPAVKARASNQQGFTLIEIAVTIVLMVILMAMAVGGLSYYQAGQAMDVATREVVSQMREAQTMAVTTGNSYRIDFSDPSHRSYLLQYRSGSGWVNVRNPQTLPSNVQFDASSLPSFGGDSYMEFYPRGTSESGQLILSGQYSKIETIQVDGETVNIKF